MDGMERLGGERMGERSSIRQVAAGQLHRHDHRVVRLLPLRHRGRAGLQQALLPRRSTRSPARWLAFGTYAVGFVARPIGGIVFGHFGDKIGRKADADPDAADHGDRHLPDRPAAHLRRHRRGWPRSCWSILRFVQGFGVGGEWGGAVLLAVEHAPAGRRGFYGSLAADGRPRRAAAGHRRLRRVQHAAAGGGSSWPGAGGCRSCSAIVLVGVGLFIRLRIMETPAFQRVKDDARPRRACRVIEVVRTYPRNLLLAMGARFAENGCFYIFTVFSSPTARRQLGLRADHVLVGVLLAAAVELFAIPLLRVRCRTASAAAPCTWAARLFSVLFAFPFFWLMDTGMAALIWLAIVLGADRARGDVRPAGELLLRAVRHPRALQRGLARLPAGLGSGRRAVPADRHALLAASGGEPWRSPPTWSGWA